MSSQGLISNSAPESETRTIRQVLREQYIIRPFQRPYSWKAEAVKCFNDFVASFNACYDPNDEPSQRTYYDNLHLNQIIINHMNGSNHLTDGQQRLSTVDLILLVIAEKLDGRKPDLMEYICSEGIAGRELNIQNKQRTVLMNNLIDGKEHKLSPNPSPTEKNLFAAYNEIKQNFPEDFVGEKLEVFAYWILDKVTLTVVKHNDSVDEVKTYELANSRNLPLTSSEKYVGEIFQGVTLGVREDEMGEVMQSALTNVFNLTHSEFNNMDKLCISVHQAKHATIAGTSETADFDKITKEVNEWLKEKGKTVGIGTVNEKHKFIMEEFKPYSEFYCEIITAMETFNPELNEVFAAGKVIPYLPSVLLAPLTPTDSKEERVLKINTLAWYMNRFRIFNTWNGDTRTTDKLRTEILHIIKTVRNKNLEDMVEALKTYALENVNLNQLGLEVPTYIKGGNNKNLAFMLTMLTDKVECAAGKPSLLASYLDGVKKFVAEIEHYAPITHNFEEEFETPENFIFYRNQVGALGIIPKTFNASYSNKNYAEKTLKYVEQNTYIGTLGHTYYNERGNLVNNKGLTDLEKAAGVKFAPHDKFTKALVGHRNELARKLIAYFFHIDNIYTVAGLQKPEETETLETAKNIVNILPQTATVPQHEMVEA
jgi:hypothetical protein